MVSSSSTKGRNRTILRLALVGVAVLCLPMLLTTEFYFGEDDDGASILDERFHRYLEEANDRPLVASSGPAALAAAAASASGVVPEGNYVFPRSSEPGREEDPTAAAVRSDYEKPDYGRVLLYVTSHFSKQHETYLKYCWKNVLANSPVLRGADVAVYLNPNEKSRRRASALSLLAEVFADNDLTVYVRPAGIIEGVREDEGTRLQAKQSGAVMAVYEAVAANYFEGYDWVVRVNPDVLIRDDAWLRESMADPSLKALVIDCHQGKMRGRNLHLHTDFFVVRPSLLRMEDMPKRVVDSSAESTFTAWVQDALYDNKWGGRWIAKSDPTVARTVPGADPAEKRTCRAGHGKDFRDSPVVHEHALHPDVCDVPEVEGMKHFFRHNSRNDEYDINGWPKSWKPVKGRMAVYDS